jgi:hypothetical protein
MPLAHVEHMASAKRPSCSLWLEQRRDEEAPDHAIKAVVLVEEQPVLAVLAWQRHTRRNREGIDVDLIVAKRVPSDLFGAKMMDIIRPAANGLDPRRDGLAVVPAVWVRGPKEGQRTANAVIERLIRRARLDRPLRRSDPTLFALGISALVSHCLERRGAPSRCEPPAIRAVALAAPSAFCRDRRRRQPLCGPQTAADWPSHTLGYRGRRLQARTPAGAAGRVGGCWKNVPRRHPQRLCVAGRDGENGRDGRIAEPSPLTVRQGCHPVRWRMSVAKAAPAPKIATAVMAISSQRS